MCAPPLAAADAEWRCEGSKPPDAWFGIGPRSEGGFGITADLTVSLPGLDRDDAQKLVDQPHQVCPYSNATRGNVDVGLTLA